jgi:hypothetical protein
MQVKMFISTLRSETLQPDISSTESEINAWIVRQGGRLTVHSITTNSFGGSGTWLLTTVLFSREDPTYPD